MAQDKTNKTDTPPAATLATSATQVIEFSEAVRRSKKLINSRLREDLVSLASGKDYTTMVGISMMRKRPGELMAWAASDAPGFDALRLSVAHKIERGEKLPPDATVWLVQYLRGEVFRPRARAGRKTEDWLHQCYRRHHQQQRQGGRQGTNWATGSSGSSPRCFFTWFSLFPHHELLHKACKTEPGRLSTLASGQLRR